MRRVIRSSIQLGTPVLLLMLLGIAAIGCAPNGEDAAGDDGSQLTLALVPKAMNNPFFDQARDGCKRAERELEGIECLYIGPGEATEHEQVQIIQSLIARGVDGIAVSPSNAPAAARALEGAREAGIPVITWDSDLLEEHRSLRATYIGTENREIGVAQGKLVAELVPEGGSLCIQSGGPAAQNHNERMQGLRDTLSGSASAAPPGERLEGGGLFVEAAGCPLYSNDDFPLAVQQIGDVLVAQPDLRVIVATGGFPQFAGQAYRQVMESYQARLDEGRLTVIVADTLPLQMDLLRDGLSHGQVGQRPEEMGYRAMEVLARMVREGYQPPDTIFTGIDVCTQDTVDTCLGAPE